MDFEKFQKINKLFDKKEIDKVAIISFYILKTEGKSELTTKDIVAILKDHSYSIPNVSRLKKHIKADKRFNIRGEKFCLSPKSIEELEKTIILEDFETIISNSDFLDEDLFNVGRTYLSKLVKQVNCAYKLNLYDAAAVLLRRIFEILLIKSYEHFKIENEIKKDGNYLMLEKIIDNAVGNNTLKLSRSRAELDKIRNVGNFAAHKIEYNTNRNDLEKIKDSYRAITEELLYKSGFKV